MKQLIFTFFAIIFCYSVFFDNDKKAVVVDEVKYINLDVPFFIHAKSDTMSYYAFPLLEYNKATSLLESSKIFQTPFINR